MRRRAAIAEDLPCLFEFVKESAIRGGTGPFSFDSFTNSSGLQREIAFLKCEVLRAVGYCGRDRCAGSVPERARVNASRAIARVCKRIAGIHPFLGRHFDHTIKTGLFCVYAPDPRVRIDWQF